MCRSQGKVIARAPAANEVAIDPLIGAGVPVDVLRSEKSVSQRWQVILEVVLGKGTGAPLQIGVILVGTSQTLQVLVPVSQLNACCKNGTKILPLLICDKAYTSPKY